jgi:hypothetical protein
VNRPRFPRGSEWRRWDLQVHTPYSELNNGFGHDFDLYAKTLLERAVDLGVAVIGVTDYFSIEGYAALRVLLADHPRLNDLLGIPKADAARSILLLPNIELRTSIIVAAGSAPASRVNFHILFSDVLSPGLLQEHFLHALKFTAESSPGGHDDRLPLSRPNLEHLGRNLKQQHSQFRTQSDLHVGMMNAVVSHEDVSAVLQSQRFTDRYLIVVPSDEDLSKCSWDGQAHLSRKLLIQKAHALFSANPNTRDFGLGKKHADVGSFIAEFKSVKACFHGSDAHTLDDLLRPAQNRCFWVRADPTFSGLRQLLNEPESRIFIGEIPPELAQMQQSGTRYIDSVRFERTDSGERIDGWFSGDLLLNAGLVAIIGNKGSGKTALAETLGLLGDSKSYPYFTFLHKDRFLAPKGKLGSLFKASLRWASGATHAKMLDAVPTPTSPELIKHIPQNYLETICSELRSSAESHFYRELMEVIFSHVGTAERLGKNSLSELIEYVTTEKEQQIASLVDAVRETNTTLIGVRDQMSS